MGLAIAMTKDIGCQGNVIDIQQQFSGEWSALVEITDAATCQSMTIYELPTEILSASLDALKAKNKGKPPFLDCPPPPVSSDRADCFEMRRTIMRHFPALTKVFSVRAVTSKGLLDTLLTAKPSGAPTKVPPPSTRRSNNKIPSHGPSRNYNYSAAVTKNYTTGTTAPSNRDTSLNAGDQLRLAQVETQLNSLQGTLNSILARLPAPPITTSAHPAATTEADAAAPRLTQLEAKIAALENKLPTSEADGANPQLTQIEAKIAALENKLPTGDAALPTAHLKRIEALESHLTTLDETITNTVQNIRTQLDVEAILSKERAEQSEKRLQTIPTLADIGQLIMEALNQTQQSREGHSPRTPPSIKRGARDYHDTPESTKRAVPVQNSDSPTARAAMAEAMECDHQASREHDPRHPRSARSTTTSHNDETTPSSHHA